MFGTRIMTAGAWRAAIRNIQPSVNPSLRQAAATLGRRQASFAPSVPGLTSQQVMWRLAAGAGAAAGMLGVCMTAEGAADKSAMWPDYVKQRVSSTYGYFAGGLALTAGSTVMLFKTGALNNFMASSPMIFAFGSLAAFIGAMMMTRSIDIHENKPLKLVSWGLMNVAMALSLVPLGFIGGPMIMKAAAYTGAVVGALSLAAMAAPDDKFMSWGAPLMMGLMVVIVASVGRIFLPAHYFVAHSVMENVCMYGGTALFSGMILYKTQVVVNNAKYSRQYDPLNASIGIYLSTINLFTSILQILSSRKR